MTGTIVELGRFERGGAVDIVNGDVMVALHVDPRAPTRRRILFPASGGPSRDLGVEPGGATFLRGDAGGWVVGGVELTLIDPDGTVRPVPAFGYASRITASRTMVAGTAKVDGRSVVRLLSRDSGTVRQLDLGQADVDSLAVSDTQIAWVDSREYGHVFVVEPARGDDVYKLAVDEPKSVHFVGEVLFIRHRSGRPAVMRWSGGPPVTIATDFKCPPRFFGHDQPIVLRPSSPVKVSERVDLSISQHLAYLADRDNVLFSGPPPDPERMVWHQPDFLDVKTEGDQAVAFLRYAPGDFRLLQFQLPSPPPPSPEIPPMLPRDPANLHIAELELDPPFQTALEAASIERLGALTARSRSELLAVPGLGPDGVDQIEEHLEDFDLALREA